MLNSLHSSRQVCMARWVAACSLLESGTSWLQGGTHRPVPVMQHVCRRHMLGPAARVRDVGSTAMWVLWQCCCTLMSVHVCSKNQGSPLEHGLAAAVESWESSGAPAWHIRGQERRQQRKRSAQNDQDRIKEKVKHYPLATRANCKKPDDPRSSF